MTKLVRRRARRYSIFAVAAVAAATGFSSVASAAVVFSDNFNRSNSSTIGNNWSETNPANPGDVVIEGNLLDIQTNMGSDVGNSFITQATANFAPVAGNVLTTNPGTITWTFNMQSSNADLSGFGGSLEGVATVLVATGGDFNTADGYAVVWGQTGGTDPIRLIRFAGGIDANANLINLVAATGGGGTPGDPNANYMSVKVIYDPASDTFELFARSDGGSAFADPTTGAYTSYGTIVDTTHTSATMTHVGFLGAYNQNNEHRRFDNLTIDIVPEPAGLALLAAGLLAGNTRRRCR